MTARRDRECDVLVLGSGVGGLSTAIVARKHGLDCIIAEKEPVFGGTTAFSGGVLWIPGNRHCRELAPNDTREAAREYLKNETGNFYQAEAVEALLDTGPGMLDWFERETEAKFVPTLYPDYHPNVGGGVDVGRSVLAAPYNSAVLGPELHRLRPALATITFIGMMFNSSNADLKHFFNATKSLTSFLYVARRLASHMKDLAIYRRGVQVTSGNALVARLAKTAFDLKIPLWTSTGGQRLIVEDGRVKGAVLQDGAGEFAVTARKGVVLACGGFPHDLERLKKAYPHVARGGEHVSPTPEGNTGDGVKLGEQAGGRCDLRFPSAAAWMPVSRVPRRDGSFGAFPHLLDRYKPGVIAVTRKGVRFCNESESYHDVGVAMIAACEGEAETAAWLICDHPTIRKYGLGYAKPAPVPLQPHIASGYVVKGNTLGELAAKAGIAAAALEKTIVDYNSGARNGQDPQFGRGATSFNRYLADSEHKPNPCIGPIETGPYYALKIVMGDLGSFDGLSTDVSGQVLNEAGAPIPGLFAVGNDRASMMGGNYPGAGITLGPIMTFAYIAGRKLAGVEGQTRTA